MIRNIKTLFDILSPFTSVSHINKTLLKTEVEQLFNRHDDLNELIPNKSVSGVCYLAVKGISSHGLYYLSKCSIDVLSKIELIVFESYDEEDTISSLPKEWLFVLEKYPFLLKKMVPIKNLNKIISPICARFYENNNNNYIAVTGTNGKSSVVSFISQLIDTSTIGTLGYGYNGSLTTLENTTPDALDLQKIIHKLRKESKNSPIAMEVSSHALSQGRVSGMCFDVSVFTNLTQDHLDFHGDMEDYFKSKSILFKDLTKKAVVLNLDNPYILRLYNEISSQKKLNICAFGRNKDIKKNEKYAYITNEVFTSKGTSFKLEVRLGKHTDIFNIKTSLIGDFNVDNVVSSILATVLMGNNIEDIIKKVNNIKPVTGRLSPIPLTNGASAIIDFAHTPDALKVALKALKKQCSGKLICVFGCGGDRDKEKRPLMAKVATSIADIIVITSDNPRTESPFNIIDDIISKKGLDKKKVFIKVNRKEAIFLALSIASSGDTVLIAGKGHEKYQIIGNKKYFFSDFDEVNRFIKEKMFKEEYFNLKVIAEKIGADVHCPLSNKEDILKKSISTISLNSRECIEGSMFIAFKGDNYDGHNFIGNAEKNGASVALVKEYKEGAKIPQIIVEDQLLALKNLASYYRDLYSKISNKKSVIAITGSVGKTTTKEMLYNILSNRYHTSATKGNLNNKIGLPLTILNANLTADYWILELGTNELGEIEYLANIARPDVSLVTMVSEAHLEGLKDLVHIAEEKSMVYKNISDYGTAVINKDIKNLNIIEKNIPKNTKKIYYTSEYFNPEKGKTSHTIVISKNISKNKNHFSLEIFGNSEFSSKSFDVEINVNGEHQIKNATAAASCAISVFADIEDIQIGLRNYKGEKGRQKIYNLKENITLIDDTYNSSPDAVKAAINILSLSNGERIAVLGEMGELGEKSSTIHKNLGKKIVEKADIFFLFGEKMKDMLPSLKGKGIHYTNKNSIADDLIKHLESNDNKKNILIKGSRTTRMESIIEILEDHYNNLTK